MTEIRIGTFNVENLLHRFDFYSYGRLKRAPALELLDVENDAEGMLLRKAQFVSQTDDTRQMTAQAIRDTRADVVCLQEVDNRAVLDDFNQDYLRKSTGTHYGWRRVLDANDNRGIDVGVLATQRIDCTQHDEHTFADFDLFNQELEDYGLSEGDRIFRRDCLEVDLRVGGAPLKLFVCHFKSMSGGRDETRPVRHAEAAAVRRIITESFAGVPEDHDWIILGDLNDYTHTDGADAFPHGLVPLFDGDFSVNIVDRIDEPDDRWTHFYTGEQSYHQLDYILLSPALAAKNPDAMPQIIRSGQPFRAIRAAGPRYPRTGFDRPKASDHCPVVVTLDV